MPRSALSGIGRPAHKYAKGKKLVDFLEWGVTEGQQYAAALHYAPLPQKIVDGVRARLGTVNLGAR